MPTKLNKAGEQQQYVPAGHGDASGEYGNASGSNKHFESFSKKELKNFGKKEIKGFSSNNKTINDFRDSVIKTKLAKLKEKGEIQFKSLPRGKVIGEQFEIFASSRGRTSRPKSRLTAVGLETRLRA